MKKTLLLLFVTVIFVYSCGSSDDDNENEIKISINPKTLSLSYNETGQLSVSGIDPESCDWETEDSFIADVNYNGKVTANHAGTTKIYAEHEGSKDSCTVTVEPLTDKITFPVMEWGISENSLKEKETHEFNYESDGKNIHYIIYLNRDNLTYLTYCFQNDELVLTYADLNNNAISFYDTISALDQWYEYFSTSSSKFWYRRYDITAMAYEKGGNGGCRIVFAANTDIINSFSF